jgi:hypothetical protein
VVGMRLKLKKYTSYVFAILLILWIVSFGQPQITTISNSSLSGRFLQSDYVSHSEITITSDTDFENQGWPGNGSEINPYRIEGLNISETTIGLYIQNTRSYFQVKNCVFSRIDFGDNIRLTNVTNGVFEDCILPNWRPGFHLTSCSDMVLRNCTIHTDSNYGLLALGCNRTEVHNSTIGETIRLYYCNDWLLNNNTIFGWRAQMIYCLNFTIIENAFIEIGMDLVIPYEPIQSIEYYNHTFQNNKVNGKPLLYQFRQNELTISGADFGQIIIIECNDTEIQDGYFKVSGIPIQLLSSFNCTLEGVSTERSYTGIAAIKSDRIQILNCKINASDNDGIYLRNCDDAKIIGCEIFIEAPEFIFSIGQGIVISDSYRALVQQNSISDCEFSGIGIVDSPFTSLMENVIENCGNGIEIHGSYVTLDNNSLRNLDNGIQVYGNHSVFVNNSIFDGRFYGIVVHSGANNNQFYANQIGWNLLQNAQDDGFMNSWDDGVSIGNSWSDYSGVGTYNISGNAGSVDHYPSLIMRDSTPPVIDHLSDISLSIEQLNQMVLLNWSIVEDYPSKYEIFVNSTSVIQGPWNGSNIIFEFEPSEIGTFNITLWVCDLSGNFAYDAVFICISTPTDTPEFNNPLLLILGIGVVGIVVILVLILKRKPGSS